jgi:hypothetical protein
MSEEIHLCRNFCFNLNIEEIGSNLLSCIFAFLVDKALLRVSMFWFSKANLPTNVSFGSHCHSEDLGETCTKKLQLGLVGRVLPVYRNGCEDLLLCWGDVCYLMPTQWGLSLLASSHNSEKKKNKRKNSSNYFYCKQTQTAFICFCFSLR